ncbi:MAG: N-acetylmuramoyl-L-alanine amidase [Mariprofundaceae bacterium]
MRRRYDDYIVLDNPLVNDGLTCSDKRSKHALTTINQRSHKGFLHTLLSITLFLATFITTVAIAGEHKVKETRLWTAPDHTRLVFDLNGVVEYKVLRLKAPARIVIDMINTRLEGKLSHLAKNDPVVKAVRHGRQGEHTLRVVIDLRESVQPRTFLLKPMHDKPYRLVVDLIRKQRKVEKITARTVSARKKIIIAIDAGHGGEDPGAIGKHGLQEKDVTLAVAKALAMSINKQPEMQAVLIRKGDYFIKLRERVRKARNVHADLMISIHADSIKHREVTGASVYTLSEKGASDKMAALLARKENASDAIGGVVPNEVSDPLVNHILADLSKRSSLESADRLAQTILKKLKAVGPIKYRQPKQARFAVLGAPEIPSVLVELDYISNPGRERLLRSDRHRKRLADALLAASEQFLRSQGRLQEVKLREHVVKHGENLWGIAKKYGVSVSSLKKANHLRTGGSLHVGQKIRLPQT